MTFPAMSTTVPWSLIKNGFHKTPHFSSVTQQTASGRRSSISLMPYPTWDFELDLNVVPGAENQSSVLQSFLGLYIATCGGGGFFLFTDPNDNTVATAGSTMLNVTEGAGAPMGQTGDGSSTMFQLARPIGIGFDILQNVSGVSVFVNGASAPATVGTSGIVTFTAAPAESAVLTWSGSFQYLCQFTDDTLKDLARVSKNASGFLWSCGSIAFESLFQ